ncbi:MAG: hypothetical protein GY906_03095, partial [bacterium]|nr:hypothetical protein [bacterium]
MRLFFASLLLSISALPASADPIFKLYVRNSGVYRVSYDTLTQTGLPTQEWPTESIGLHTAGKSVPVHIEGGQDGIFGPGDSLVFVGEMLRGEYSYLDEYSSFNCYFLDFDDSSPRQFTTSVTQDRATVKSPAAAFESRYHLEQ